MQRIERTTVHRAGLLKITAVIGLSTLAGCGGTGAEDPDAPISPSTTALTFSADGSGGVLNAPDTTLGTHFVYADEP